MCWSLEASLITWVIATVTGLYLLCRRHKNDIVMGILILTYASMQLWEALMWYDQKCGKVNLIGTKLAYIALWSHIVAIGIGLWIEYKTFVPFLIGLAFLGTAYLTRPKEWKCSKPSPVNKHLEWGFDPSFYMYVFATAIALSLMYIRPIKIAYAISLLFIISFLLCALYTSKTRAIGSFWCWICAFFSFVFIAVNL